MSIHNKVTRVKDADISVRNISLESLRPRGREERVMLPPDGHHLGFMFSQVGLPSRVGFDVILVITQERHLDVDSSRKRRVVSVQGSPIGVDELRLRHADLVRAWNALRCEDVLDSIHFGRIFGIGPERPDHGKRWRQTFFVCIAGLREEAGNALGMLRSEYEADWRSEIEEVQAILGQAKLLCEFVQRVGKVDERVGVILWCWSTRVPEARVVRRYDME